MRAIVHVGGTPIPVEVVPGGVRVDGVFVAAELAPRSGSPVRSALVAGRSVRVVPTREVPGRWILEAGGVRHLIEVLDPAEEAMRTARKAAGHEAGPPPLKAPMPGLVVKVEVSPGDVVAEGGGLLIVEAMKMENELRAVRAVRVKEVRVREGETIERDQVLVVFEAVEGSP